MKPELNLKKLINGKGGIFIIIGLIAGICLLLIPTASEPEAQQEKAALTTSEYCAMLEAKTKAAVEALPNVKSCSVFITVEKGYCYVYATDQHVNQQGEGKQTDKTVVLADGANGEAPILIQETMPLVSGVAVVCPGASYETQYKIIQLICALYNLPSNRISVQT